MSHQRQTFWPGLTATLNTITEWCYKSQWELKGHLSHNNLFFCSHFLESCHLQQVIRDIDFKNLNKLLNDHLTINVLWLLGFFCSFVRNVKWNNNKLTTLKIPQHGWSTYNLFHNNIKHLVIGLLFINYYYHILRLLHKENQLSWTFVRFSRLHFSQLEIIHTVGVPGSLPQIQESK